MIAYGNELRGDDGAAWVLARRCSDYRVLCVTQLVPELVETLKELDEVVFVDACRGGSLGWLELIAQPEPASAGHFGHPGRLLALCGRLYGRSPRAYLLTLPGENFEHHLGLSATARQSVRRGLRLLRRRRSGNPAAEH